MTPFTEQGVRLSAKKRDKRDRHFAKEQKRRAEKARTLAKSDTEADVLEAIADTDTETDDLDSAVDALYARVIALDDEVDAVIRACKALDDAETTEKKE